MLDITFYKKENNDFTHHTIELCDEDYKKLIILNFEKIFHPEKKCLIVEGEEYSINVVYCNTLVLTNSIFRFKCKYRSFLDYSVGKIFLVFAFF